MPSASQTSQALPARPAPSQSAAYVSATGSYGSGVRAQVFEVIVRQALAGAPWKEICAGPMQVITSHQMRWSLKLNAVRHC